MGRLPILVAVLAIVAAGCSTKSSSKSSDGKTPGPHTIGGTVTGLVGTGLALGLNGLQDVVEPTGNGTFAFTGSYADGFAYEVTVLVQPVSPDQICTVARATGTMAGRNVTDVAVTCSGATALVSGLYARSAVTGRSDACGILPSSATLTGNLASVTLAASGPGSIDLVTPEWDPFPFTSGLISGSVTGTTFSTHLGDSLGVDSMMLAGTCQLDVTYDVDGTITALGRAHATVTASAALTGTDCAAVEADVLAFIGGTAGAHFPCTASLALDLAFDHAFPVPPVYLVNSVVASAAPLTDPSAAATGTGSYDLVFEDVPATDASATSVCYAPGTYSTPGGPLTITSYVVLVHGADYQIEFDVPGSSWGPGGDVAVDGASVTGSMVRLADGLRVTAVDGTLHLSGTPAAIGAGYPCDASATSVHFQP
jgi:hypothetical protein